jgi:hypothetical protein
MRSRFLLGVAAPALATLAFLSTAEPASAQYYYGVDLQARQMVEFGHVLPEPGEEPAWTAALPQSDREMMQTIGSGHH